MRWVAAATAAVFLFLVAALGTFVPLAEPAGLVYLFAWPGERTVQIAAVSAALGIVATYWLVVAAVRRRALDRLAEARSGRWLAPIAALAAVVAGLAPAVPGVGERGAVFAYFLYDLRWWWCLIAGAAVLWRIHAMVGAPLRGVVAMPARWSPAGRLLALDALLFVLVAGWAYVTSPHLRFSGLIVGDEAKYVRQCENWYQGFGADISKKALITEIPLDAGPAVFANIGHVFTAMGEDAAALSRDLAAFAADPFGFRWNRAVTHRGFVGDKTGTRVYQLYLPGTSALLFPGYFLDRYLLGVEPGYQAEFPADLVMTNLTMLLLFAAAAVALFRLLRDALGDDRIAWIAAAIAMMTLPAAAFPFQLYPEVPALLVITAVTRQLLFGDGRRFPRRTLIAGAAAGGLVWLHPRFLLVSAAFIAIAMWQTTGAARRAFMLGAAALVFTLCAYNFHITGSWLPTAMWDASVDSHSVEPSIIPANLIAYAIHQTLGAIPHAIWLLPAIPAVLFLAREQPRHALMLTAIVLSLAIPAAGHVLTPAGGTPSRLIMAVVPLAMWPVAWALRRMWGVVAVRVVTIAGAVLSLEAAVAYNLGHRKEYGLLVDSSLSGWRPNLAFPEMRDYFGNLADPGLASLLVALALFAGWFVCAWRRRDAVASARAAWTAAVVLIICVGAATALTAANGRWVRSSYLLHPRIAMHRAQTALVDGGRCRICFTSKQRQIDWTALAPPSDRDPAINLGVEDRLLWLGIELGSAGDGDRLARVSIDFGDGSSSRQLGIVGRREVTHAYARPGSYTCVVSMSLPDRQWTQRYTVDIK